MTDCFCYFYILTFVSLSLSDDLNLPSVPPVLVTIPPDYPRNSPVCEPKACPGYGESIRLPVSLSAGQSVCRSVCLLVTLLT